MLSCGFERPSASSATSDWRPLTAITRSRLIENARMSHTSLNSIHGRPESRAAAHRGRGARRREAGGRGRTEERGIGRNQSRITAEMKARPRVIIASRAVARIDEGWRKGWTSLRHDATRTADMRSLSDHRLANRSGFTARSAPARI